MNHTKAPFAWALLGVEGQKMSMLFTSPNFQIALAMAEVMLARSDTETINLPKISKGETGSIGTALLKFPRSEEYITLALHLEFHTPIISRAAKKKSPVTFFRCSNFFGTATVHRRIRHW